MKKLLLVLLVPLFGACAPAYYGPPRAAYVRPYHHHYWHHRYWW